jgi:hypothetical protein
MASNCLAQFLLSLDSWSFRATRQATVVPESWPDGGDLRAAAVPPSATASAKSRPPDGGAAARRGTVVDGLRPLEG